MSSIESADSYGLRYYTQQFQLIYRYLPYIKKWLQATYSVTINIFGT